MAHSSNPVFLLPPTLFDLTPLEDDELWLKTNYPIQIDLLPLNSIMSNSVITNDSFSWPLNSVFLPSASNKTDPCRAFEDRMTSYRHPVLYVIGFYALLLIIVGTIGNTLTIIILLRPTLRKHTTMRYLTAVAIADLCSLYSWNLNLFYKHLINSYQNDLEDSSVIPCRIVSFLAFVSLQLSSWYLTLVSIDRCLSIYFPHWYRQFSSATHSVYIILTVTIIILTLNMHLLLLNGYKKPNCIPYEKRTCFECYARANDKHYIFPKWEQVHVIIYNFIPFSIMLVSNSFIIHRSTKSANQHRNYSTDKRTNSSSKPIRRRKQRQLTRILLVVTFLFVFLTMPVMIYNVFLRNRLKCLRPLKYIIHGTLLCIQFTSHAINFFVYCCAASNFRRELEAWFSCFIKRKSAIEHQPTSTRLSRTCTR